MQIFNVFVSLHYRERRKNRNKLPFIKKNAIGSAHLVQDCVKVLTFFLKDCSRYFDEY